MMTDANPKTSRALGGLCAAWGVVGVLALLLKAITGLAPIALSAVQGGLSTWQWGILILWVAIMAYSEGYRGFQLRFSPFVAARTLELRARPTLLRGVLAPAFCMGLFQATRRRLLISWGVLIGVTLLVIGVRLLDQPWRGIVDAGVVVGLSWGALSLVASVFRALFTGEPSVDPELPSRLAGR